MASELRTQRISTKFSGFSSKQGQRDHRLVTQLALILHPWVQDLAKGQYRVNQLCVDWLCANWLCANCLCVHQLCVNLRKNYEKRLKRPKRPKWSRNGRNALIGFSPSWFNWFFVVKPGFLVYPWFYYPRGGGLTRHGFNIFEYICVPSINGIHLLIPPLGVGHRGSLTSPTGALYSAARVI